MKKLIILTLAIATSTLHANSTARDAVVGGVLGAIIGNNIGDGDSRSGAVIGAISGVIVGGQRRGSQQYRGSQCGTQYHVRQHTRNHYHNIRSGGCNCNTKTIRIEERVWIPEKKVYDTCGKLLYYEPGRYETSYRFRSVPVCGR